MSGLAAVGVLVTILGLYYAFAGAHSYYGGRAVLVLGLVLLLSILSYRMSTRPTYVKSIKKAVKA